MLPLLMTLVLAQVPTPEDFDAALRVVAYGKVQATAPTPAVTATIATQVSTPAELTAALLTNKSIDLKPGVYSGRMYAVKQSGTKDAPIVIDGHGATIVGTRSCFEIVGASHVVIKNLICERSTSYNVMIGTNSHYVTLEDVWMRDGPGMLACGLSIGSETLDDALVPSFVTMRRCKFSNNGRLGARVGINGPARAWDVLFEDCDSWANGAASTESAVGFCASFGSATTGRGLTPTQRITYRRCISRGDLSGGIELVEVRDTTIEDCIVWGTTLIGDADGRGIVVGLSGAGGGLVRNCIVFGNAKAGIYSENAPKADVRDCIVFANGHDPKTTQGCGILMDDGSYTNNIAFANKIDGRKVAAGTAVQSGNHWADGSLPGTSGDPKLIGTAEVMRRLADQYAAGAIGRSEFMGAMFAMGKRVQ